MSFGIIIERRVVNIMYLALVRHGESIWNRENRFTGWTDVELTEKGIEEAYRAGLALKNSNIEFDLAYTSVLMRANKTLECIKEKLGYDLKTVYSYKLNERHYGALQGLNKAETALKYGEEQVHLWRRSYDVKPPLLEKDDKRFPGFDSKYDDIPKEELPLAESLKDTYERVIPYYLDEIKNNLKDKNIIISAHGNSLRALIKYLENIKDEDIPNLEIPTGEAILYEFNENLSVIDKRDLT